MSTAGRTPRPSALAARLGAAACVSTSQTAEPDSPPRPCPDCSGSGYDPWPVKCKRCGGEGYLYDQFLEVEAVRGGAVEKIVEAFESEASRMDEVAQAARAVGDPLTATLAKLMAESYRWLARGLVAG